MSIGFAGDDNICSLVPEAGSTTRSSNEGIFFGAGPVFNDTEDAMILPTGSFLTYKTFHKNSVISDQTKRKIIYSNTDTFYMWNDKNYLSM